jgi:hypothetical protein
VRVHERECFMRGAGIFAAVLERIVNLGQGFAFAFEVGAALFEVGCGFGDGLGGARKGLKAGC